MVSSIVPGTTSATALGVEPRYTRAQTGAPAQTANDSVAQGDRVDVSDAAAWRASSESVSAGLAQLNEALSAGRDVYGLLNNVASLAQNPDASPADLADLLGQVQQRVNGAISQGASILTGADISVQAEPGAPPVTVQGLDLRLSDNPGANAVIAVSSDADLSDPQALGQAAQRSLTSLQSGMERLTESARALEAHQGFLGAVAGSIGGVRGDLDADSARLLALQVRQGLDAAGGASIANVEPQAVLSLFRA